LSKLLNLIFRLTSTAKAGFAIAINAELLRQSSNPSYRNIAALLDEARKRKFLVDNGKWLLQYVCKKVAELCWNQIVTAASVYERKQRCDELVNVFEQRARTLAALGMREKALAVLRNGRKNMDTEAQKRMNDVGTSLGECPFAKLAAEEVDLAQQLDYIQNRFSCGVLSSALKALGGFTDEDGFAKGGLEQSSCPQKLNVTTRTKTGCEPSCTPHSAPISLSPQTKDICESLAPHPHIVRQLPIQEPRTFRESTKSMKCVVMSSEKEEER
jgi:hypothetical protein